MAFVFFNTISLSPTHNTRQLARLSDCRAWRSAHALTGVDFFTAPGPRPDKSQWKAGIVMERRASQIRVDHHVRHR